MNARRCLAADQAELLAALVAGAPLPFGFDAAAAAAVAESLWLRRSSALPDRGRPGRWRLRASRWAAFRERWRPGTEPRS